MIVAMLSILAVAAAAQTSRSIPPPPDVAAPPADAAKTASGLASKVIKPGNGSAHPTASDTVTVHYTGWTTDGRMFDSSHTGPNRPVSFPLDKVIKGWTEGLQLVGEGSMIELEIPHELAYGVQGRPGIPSRATLHFLVELNKVR